MKNKRKERKRLYQLRASKRKLRLRLKRQKHKPNSGYTRKIINIKRRLASNITKKPIPPKNFSFIDNPEEVIKYIKKLKNFSNAGHSVHIDLSNITNLTPDALLLLLANFQKDTKYTGAGPKDQNLQKIFLGSGFYEHVQNNADIKEFSGAISHHESDYRVDSEIGKNITIGICQHTFPEIKVKNIYINPILVECMGNTENHAAGKRGKRCSWWLGFYKETTTGVSKVFFIDSGIGIMGSLNQRPKTIKREYLSFFSFSDEAKLHDLVHGKIRIPTRTMSPQRGKGIKSFKEFSKIDYVKNFTIISNSVLGKISEDKFIHLCDSFEGTFIYFEIHPI
ncbi:hypothetical protein KBC86_00570 [Candidatus Gracilibacteria bacterium]|nr:hypothetical protein [Candidatus Gracilibacteria bacterium]